MLSCQRNVYVSYQTLVWVALMSSFDMSFWHITIDLFIGGYGMSDDSTSSQPPPTLQRLSSHVGMASFVE